jgi:hypothetical protein
MKANSFMSEDANAKPTGLPKSLILKLVAVKIVIIAVVAGAVLYML